MRAARAKVTPIYAGPFAPFHSCFQGAKNAGSHIFPIDLMFRKVVHILSTYYYTSRSEKEKSKSGVTSPMFPGTKMWERTFSLFHSCLHYCEKWYTFFPHITTQVVVRVGRKSQKVGPLHPCFQGPKTQARTFDLFHSCFQGPKNAGPHR